MTNNTSVMSVLGKLPSLGSLFLRALKFAPTALVLYLVIWNLWSTGTVVEPIGMPKRIEEMGFSSAGLAGSLAAEIRQIQEGDGQKKYRQEIKAAVKELDIQVPGLPIPLHSALEIIRKAVGLQQQRVSGEIIEEAGKLVLLLAGGKAASVPVSLDSDRELAMRTLMQRGAQTAMSTIDCAALAKWSFQTARSSDEPYDDTLQIIESCLKNSAQESDHATSIRLYMVLALVKAAQKHPEDAQKQFDLALEINSRVKGADPARYIAPHPASGEDYGQLIHYMSYNFVPAEISAVPRDALRASVLLNEGLTLNSADHPEEALDVLNEAAAFDGRSVEVASALGNVYRSLTTVKRKEGDDAGAEENLRLAEAQFTRARDLDPTYADTFFNWANLLADNNRCNDALKHFQKAAELRPLDLEIYSNWARTLANMGKYKQAFKLIEIALNGSSAQASKGPPLAFAYSNKGAILDLRLHDETAELDKRQRVQMLWQKVAAYAQSIREYSDYPEAHYQLARAFRELELKEPSDTHAEISKELLAKSQQDLAADDKPSRPSEHGWESFKYCPSQKIGPTMTFQNYENIDLHDVELISTNQIEAGPSGALIEAGRRAGAERVR